MSVIKSKRNINSEFKVFNTLDRLTDDITEASLRAFGYSESKAVKRIERRFGGRKREELSEDQQKSYDVELQRMKAFCEYFIPAERRQVLLILRDIAKYVMGANSIYPQYQEELMERRMYQDKAIGCCCQLEWELQYIARTLPINTNVLLKSADDVNEYVKLLKAWRKSDNRFKKLVEPSSPEISKLVKLLQEAVLGVDEVLGLNNRKTDTSENVCSSANFCNVNNNGNANNNNASNVNGVRPR